MHDSLSEERGAAAAFADGDGAFSYEYFGARLAERDGQSGVLFRLWAPNAQSVAIVGDFNAWDEAAHLMCRNDDGNWELFISGVCEGDAYQFRIETPAGDRITKSDPFAFYAQNRPDTASRVCRLDDYAWGDEEWLSRREHRDSLRCPMNIYEIHAGSWKRNPDGSFYTYRQLADELTAYLTDMHFTHVQFMPLMEHPYDRSWGFQTTGYFAATARYGTPEDLMYLIDTLHRHNIGVIMDWVPSNFPKDDFALSRFDGTALFESEDPKLGERPSWDTCLFNFARPEVVSFLVSSAVFWLRHYHLDGLRVGALSSMLYLDYGKKAGEWEPNRLGGKENLEAIDFVKRLNTAVHLFCPQALMFTEETTSWPKVTHRVEDGGLGFDYKWNRGWMNDMLHYMTLDPKWRPFNHDNLTFSFFYAFSEHFVLPVSHDEVSNGKGSILSKMPGNGGDRLAGLRAFITYMFAHPGKKLIFMGTEIGQLEEWDVDGIVEWEFLDTKNHAQLQVFYRELNRFYIDNPPFYEMDTIWKGFDWIHHDDYTNSVIAFKRTDSGGNDIIAVCNFQPVEHRQYMIGVPVAGAYDEVFNSDNERYGGSGVTNSERLMTVPVKLHGCNQSLSLTLPPMGVIYLRCAGETPDETK
ncbi:MAG: 1,4-alpha-glucan branching protein GlgB [Ruminococcus sp.]|nr:1,4-alpha-glucan branching protein GlgB [Ruminococcus sp.]